MIRKIALAAPAATLFAGAVAAQSSIDMDGASFDGQGVVISGVQAENPGYLVVTEELPEGAPATDAVAIGYAPVEAGENTDIRVDGPFEPGIRYSVWLFNETNDEPEFQWGEDIDLSDTPTMNDGMPVVTSFELMMESGDDSDG